MENSVNRLFDLFEVLRKSADWRAVFGEPQQQGETIIIPVASISYGMGLGMGTAGAPAGEERELPPGAGGGGGGLGGMSRPVAVIEISPERVFVRPILEYGRLIVAGMVTVAWIVLLWTSVLRKFIRYRQEHQG